MLTDVMSDRRQGGPARPRHLPVGLWVVCTLKQVLYPESLTEGLEELRCEIGTIFR